MHIKDLLKKNKRVGLIIFIGALIVFSAGTIFYIDNSSNKSSKNIKSNLIGYDSFKAEIIANSNYSEGTSNRIKSYLNILESNKTTDEEKYKAVSELSKIFSSIYGDTNDPKYRSIFDLLSSFAKNNFPKLYQESDYKVLCQDSQCADSPQPTEILEIIEKIKASNLPTNYKESIENELINAGYIPNKYKHIRFDDYYHNLSVIKTYLDNKSSEDPQIQDIYNQLRNFLEKKYPNELQEREKILEKQQ